MNQLQGLDEIERRLTNAKTMNEFHDLMKLTILLESAARNINASIEETNEIIQKRIRIQRGAGNLLLSNEVIGAPGKRTDITSTHGVEVGQTFKERGLHTGNLHRWKLIAYIPEERFRDELQERIEKLIPLASSYFYKLGERLKKEMEGDDEIDESIADNVVWHTCPECNHTWPE